MIYVKVIADRLPENSGCGPVVAAEVAASTAAACTRDVLMAATAITSPPVAHPSHPIAGRPGRPIAGRPIAGVHAGEYYPGRGAAWGAAAVGAATAGAYGYYNNSCYYDTYGSWVCPGQYPY